MVTCKSCSSINADDAKFCNNCGSPLTQPAAKSSTNPQQPSPYTVQTGPVRSPKEKSIALVLEILPGLFGFLGFGWIYAGNTSAGIIWLVGFLGWTVVATIISFATGGVGIFCWLPVSIAGITFSTASLNKYTNNHPELFGN